MQIDIQAHSLPFQTSVVYTLSPVVSYKATRVGGVVSESSMQLSSLE